MGSEEAINLSSLVFLHDCSKVDLTSFCYWASQVLGQGLHFVAGTYAGEGVAPRPNWAFWAPVRSPSGEDYESIFTARREGGFWRYALFFYGDDEALHSTLAACVLHADVAGELGYTSVLGRPQQEEDEGVPVTRFELIVEAGRLHTISLLTAAQFG
jgi:hypothetical protein